MYVCAHMCICVCACVYNMCGVCVCVYMCVRVGVCMHKGVCEWLQVTLHELCFTQAITSSSSYFHLCINCFEAAATSFIASLSNVSRWLAKHC